MLRKTTQIFVLAAFASAITACKDKPQTDNEETQYTDETAFAGIGGTPDSTTQADNPERVGEEEIVFEDSTDAAEPEDQRTPPEAVDANFNDFLYAYNVNRRFFVDRTTFPFEVEKNGKSEKLYNYKAVRNLYHQTITPGYYTLLYTSTGCIDEMDGEGLDKVSVEAHDLETGLTNAFRFTLDGGKWHMHACEQYATANDHAASFLTFYAQFANNAEYRREHLAPLMETYIMDDETGEPIEGVITPEQFEMFFPELPHGTIVNINYGQPIDQHANTMYMRKCNLMNGEQTNFTFSLENGEWTLVSCEG